MYITDVAVITHNPYHSSQNLLHQESKVGIVIVGGQVYLEASLVAPVTELAIRISVVYHQKDREKNEPAPERVSETVLAAPPRAFWADSSIEPPSF